MNSGILNEYVFINNINDKKYKETNILIQELLKTLYPWIKENDLIIAYKYGKYAKTDIVISVRNVKKGISIKSGDRNSVHLEKIDTFCKYISKYRFNEIERLKRYLYSDGTNNNTGKVRYSAEEYKQKFPEDIVKINNELDKIKKNLIERFLIKSDINYKIKVDVIVYGTINDFIWATKEEIISYLINKKNESSAVHVSSLNIQNWDRNLKKNPKYEYCRNYIQVKWFNLFDDIIQIMCIRNELSNQADSVKQKKNSAIAKFLKFIWSDYRKG